jgi:nitrogen fixation/metabolism regulation signal transduction histidine kinase
MSSRIYFWNILARVSLIILTSFLFIWFTQMAQVEFVFILLTAVFLISLQIFLLTRYTLGITRVIEQFIEAVGQEEGPEIQFGTGKVLFRSLKEKSNAIKEAMNQRRLEKEKDDRILVHVINSADQGLFCFNSKKEVVFANQAALAWLSHHSISHMDDIARFNKKLGSVLSGLAPGSPRVIRLGQENSGESTSGSEQLLSVRLKELKIFEESYKLFSLQNIQEELHKNESDSWQKIIRVLTHEIMNAVAPMLSLSKSLQTKLRSGKFSDTNKIAEGLSMIENTGQGLMAFTEEYRRLSLLPPPRLASLPVSEAFRGIAMLIESDAERHKVKLEMAEEEEGMEISADAQQLEMILLNLWKNALESFPERQKDKRVKFRSLTRNDRVWIQVEDNGTGISPELIDQVFVPFFSTKEQGSGIGLSLSRQIMNNHEGSIHMESAPGEGTVVSLVF